MRPRIWIITPCYFDLQSFEWIRLEIIEALKPLRQEEPLKDSELLFAIVDDSGGQDPEFKSQWFDDKPDVRVIRVPFNLGHQGAIVYGLRSLLLDFNEIDYIVTMDSDGEDSPSAVSTLIKAHFETPENLRVISFAYRMRRYESIIFKFMLVCFQLMFLILTGTIVRTGNFACMRGSFVKSALNHPFFDHCYSSSLLCMPVKQKFIPLNKGTRKFGKSKMTYVTLIAHGIRMLMPFLEKAAVRSIIGSAIGMAISICLVIINFFFWRSGAMSSSLIMITLLSFVLSLSILCTACIFFMMVNQNRAINIRRLSFERERIDSFS